MAKVLTTKQSAAALEDILLKAKERVYILSYSLHLSDHFLGRIQQTAKRGVTIHVVHGRGSKNELVPDLLQTKNVKAYYVPNLHAKVFANEAKCVIGSMNLSAVSEANNEELGVLLSKQNDKEAYDDAIMHCENLIKSQDLNTDTIVAEPTLDKETEGLSRFIFVRKALAKWCRRIEKQDESRLVLPDWNLLVFVNEERIDFIFDDTTWYKPMRDAFSNWLSQKIKERFWVNHNRINISAADNKAIQLSINSFFIFLRNNNYA